MNHVYTIGEALIDFLPLQDGVYERHFGGAPANVALGITKLGGSSEFIGQVGDDAFGHFIINTFQQAGVPTTHIVRSTLEPTPLAFVTLNKAGERSFSFYRHNTADLNYQSAYLDEIDFLPKSILHFCSVGLVESPLKDAHYKAIKIIQNKNGVISFDPNLRFHIWRDKEALKTTVLEFLTYVDVLKVSEEELYFLANTQDEKKAVQFLKQFDIHAILISKGAQGASLYYNDNYMHHSGYNVVSIDTTGAGDAFVAAVLRMIQRKDIYITELGREDWNTILQYANAAGAITTTKKGATTAFPSHETITAFVQNTKENIVDIIQNS